MGLADRRPILPAPTDSAIGSADEASPAEQDLATDLSRVTDRTHHTVPDDGSPITITTAQYQRTGIGKLVKTNNPSQTSLLIEYFEDGSGKERRPSVRVKVTPSNSKKSRHKGDGHIAVPEAQSGRNPSLSKRFELRPGESRGIVDASTISPLDSEIGLQRPRARQSELSKLSSSPEARYILAGSDISSMPGDSSLGVSRPAIMTQPQGSEFSHEESWDQENLKPPVFPAGRNLSNERITQKVIQKLSNKPRVAPNTPMTSDRTRSRSSVSRELGGVSEPRRRTTKHLDDDSVTGTGSSMVSTSLLSADPRSVDQRSVRSGNSATSINNPKLLQTVEDAIRRLILPELKEIKQDQRHTTHRSGKDYPADLSESSVSREDVSRRKSSSNKTRRRSSREHGHRVSSGSKRHERSKKTVDYDSPSEHSYRQSESFDTTSIDEDRKSRKHHKSHKYRDLAAAGIAGGALTAAALKHHESGSSLDHQERRKKRSKSRSSRSASVAEGTDVFHKHDVPPMPMRSDLDSELTRSSLLSSNNGAATPTRRELREVIRGSPQELLSPTSQTPSRTPIQKTSPERFPTEMKRELGMHHGNLSSQDLGVHPKEGERELDEDSPETYREYGSIGLLTDPERAEAYERNLHTQHPIRRGLSPIQSVASYATTEPNRNSVIQPRSEESLTSRAHEHKLKNEISIASLSSAPSTELAKSHRPKGLSLENRSEVMIPHKQRSLENSRGIDADEFFDEQHSQNDQHRDSYASSGAKIPLQHMSNYTDDSMEEPYLDKVTAGQQLGPHLGANPEYINTPPGVESAVASLCEPSVLDIRDRESPRLSQAGSYEQSTRGSPYRQDRNFEVKQSDSPLKQQMLAQREPEIDQPRGFSPAHSVTQSSDRDYNQQFGVEKPSEAVEAVPMTSDKDATSPESEITTNPSVIQGPIAGYQHGSRDHWPYGATPPPVKQVMTGNRDLGTPGADLIPEPLSMGHTQQKPEVYTIGGPVDATPPGAKDEGYETGANAPSPAAIPRDLPVTQPAAFSPVPQFDDMVSEDDPFVQKRDQYMSGLSQGMSPLYDSATGRGADRIQSKDIVALMDHLTVRDAQRSARDTEILITLVRTAAEMRNSFEDMKKFVADQGDVILDTSDKQHEKTQKAIGGARPQPQSAPRFTRTPASEDEDLPTKRRNVFKRALQGLGTKNNQELQNIEGMLMQLLNDMDGLRSLHTGGSLANEPRSTSINSAEHSRLPTDPGYEPEGQAGTSSTGGRSGVFSNDSSRQANYRGIPPAQNGNRVSTVLERDEEEDDDYDGPQAYDQDQTTPRATMYEEPASFIRGDSEPLRTPTRLHDSNQGTLSNDNTPHTETTSSKKHKSFASSFLPKMVSRWSKTTASSGGEYRNSAQAKPRPYSQVSRSGSHLDEYDYDAQGDDRLRSNTSLQHDQSRGQENRPPSPLVPSQLSENPKYQAHRNSLNLQHPQPRQGTTGRFQNHLESEARYYHNDPMSPSSVTSSQWEHQAALSDLPGAGPSRAYTHGGQLSPILDTGYSETSEALHDRDGPIDVRSTRSTSSSSRQGPPRPPKIPDDDPLVPQRPPKVMMSPPSSRQATYVDHVAAARAGSPGLDKVRTLSVYPRNRYLTRW